MGETDVTSLTTGKFITVLVVLVFTGKLLEAVVLNGDKESETG